MNRISKMIRGTLIVIVGFFALYEITKWTAMRVYVPPGRALMVINKFGDPLPPELIAVPTDKPNFKGVREELLSPGRYFINPVEYETKLVDQVLIPAGDPQAWRFTRDGKLEDEGAQPMVGLVSCN